MRGGMAVALATHCIKQFVWTCMYMYKRTPVSSSLRLAFSSFRTLSYACATTAATCPVISHWHYFTTRAWVANHPSNLIFSPWQVFALNLGTLSRNGKSKVQSSTFLWIGRGRIGFSGCKRGSGEYSPFFWNSIACWSNTLRNRQGHLKCYSWKNNGATGLFLLFATGGITRKGKRVCSLPFFLILFVPLLLIHASPDGMPFSVSFFSRAINQWR